MVKLGRILCGALLAGAVMMTGGRVLAADGAGVGVVSHIKVLSDKVPDISSLEAWKKSFIKDDMTEEQKAEAVWKSVVMFRHQANPPHEFLTIEGDVHDPIRAFNVYGYGQCCCASAAMEALGRYAGLEARGWGITNHSVPELKVNGQWCMFDGSLVNYFKKPDGTVAGVDDINKSILDWMGTHKDFKTSKETSFMANDGWKKGPAILAGSVSYGDDGFLPAHTHSWGDSMVEFGGKKNFVFEYGVALGYEVNIQLRPGEKLIRNWGNKGLHVNMLEDGKAPLKDNPQNPNSDLHYALKYDDMTTGRIGNGTLEYDLPLANGAFRGGMLTVDNIDTSTEDKGGPAVHVKDAASPGVIIFRMPTSYIYLSGELDLKAIVGNGGSIEVSFSDNNGMDWKPVQTVSASGEQKIDLKSLVYRHYDYQLKLELKGAGTGLDEVKVTHDIQHSQRPLPILGDGDNKISFSSGPQEGTITIEGVTNDAMTNKKGPEPVTQALVSFHPEFDNVNKTFIMTGGTGSVTFPVSTPGDMTRIRVGAHYRARGAKDSWTMEASFDGGKTWKEIGKCEGPVNASSKYFVFDGVPAGTKTALVRAEGKQSNTTMLFDFRIDADYKEPAGGFTPVKVIYDYEEGGKEKQDVHVAKTADEGYVIHCNGKPVMKSITLELAE